MHKKFYSRNVMEPLQKHDFTYEDNRIYVKETGYSRAQFVVFVVKDLVVNCCE